jgi:hypothetical protein
MKAIRYLGAECVRCGFREPRALQIDHVAGDGDRDIRVSGRTSGGNRNRSRTDRTRIYAQIARGERRGEFQVLCANCHAIKTREERDYLPSSASEPQGDLF